MLAGTVASISASSVGKPTTRSISAISAGGMLLCRRSKLRRGRGSQTHVSQEPHCVPARLSWGLSAAAEITRRPSRRPSWVTPGRAAKSDRRECAERVAALTKVWRWRHRVSPTRSGAGDGGAAVLRLWPGAGCAPPRGEGPGAWHRTALGATESCCTGWRKRRSRALERRSIATVERAASVQREKRGGVVGMRQVWAPAWRSLTPARSPGGSGPQ